MNRQLLVRAAYARYGMKRLALGAPPEPVVPDEPGPVHAVPSPRFRRPTAPVYLEGTATSAIALCGRQVRVVMPAVFDGEDPDACPICAKHNAAGTRHGPPERQRLETARVIPTNLEDGTTVHHVRCAACGFTGPDHTSEWEATTEMTDHNLDRHEGRQTDNERW
ncbi:hypothetical protein GCM10023198_20630 [Promicromonospora umidemergens]|uniref:Uncharacterized protein n=2 Tax=Promicromonospora umidemergens TaxID=629679 RepID=A0ABP8X4U1_9MICO